MKPIKCLFLLHLPPPIHGAAMVGDQIKKSEIINSKYDITYINISTHNKLNQTGKADIIKFIRIKTILKNILNSHKNNNYALTYITLTASGLGFYKDAMVILLLKAKGHKTILHFHNQGIASNSIWKKYICRRVFKESKCILLSNRLYHDVQDYVSEKDVYYLPNGIPELPANITNKSLKHRTEFHPCKLLFVSNMLEMKGIFYLLEACKILKEASNDFVCDFVGGWSTISEVDFLKKIKGLNLEDYVCVHGPMYDAEKYRFFQAADIFVFPTLSETFGLVNLEAMQFGLPIISTTEGGIPDVVIDGVTGFLVPARDAKALANRILELLINPSLRMQMGQAGRRRYLDYFTSAVFEKSFSDIVQREALTGSIVS